MLNNICSRCKEGITCRPEDINNCPCNDIVLDEDVKAYLKKTNYKCLCNKCLISISNTLTKIHRSGTNSSLQEGLHYYMEGRLMVFTEYYHIQKGYCCGNGCRHCAYGFDKG